MRNCVKIQRAERKLKKYKVNNPCKIKSSKAMLNTIDNIAIFGNNALENMEIKTCPKKKSHLYPEGMDICKEVCLQKGTAISEAINSAKLLSQNIGKAEIYLQGETEIDEVSRKLMIDNKIDSVYLVDENIRIKVHQLI